MQTAEQINKLGTEGAKNTAESEEYLRFSYATSSSNIEKGLERIRQALLRA